MWWAIQNKLRNECRTSRQKEPNLEIGTGGTIGHLKKKKKLEKNNDRKKLIENVAGSRIALGGNRLNV